ncbi:lipoprotein [Bradyrhizobium sp. CB82]|uniref:LPS translocon maturation chaperone LptM n=1 Tax=Bradyrhizobium sp. CB82 TaxID=3039159 RepID=UPI0024B0D387|nr:lipoprotein [Bradyrhizobium sp. CB82]WFU42269.1 lipoprotein [Bradyrhizobium sp. CB82]
MTSKFRPTGSGWAIIVLSLSALALAGCGRKGPLDLPPTASNASTANVAPAATDTEAEAQKTPSVFNPTYGADAAPAASKGKKKSFVLDPLLDEKPGR